MFNFNLDAMSSKWTQNSAAQKLLDEKFRIGQITTDTKPKKLWQENSEFQKFKLATFCTHLHKAKMKHGGNLDAMVEFSGSTNKDDDSNDDSQHYKTDLHNNSPKKQKADTAYIKPWYKKMVIGTFISLLLGLTLLPGLNILMFLFCFQRAFLITLSIQLM